MIFSRPGLWFFLLAICTQTMSSPNSVSSSDCQGRGENSREYVLEQEKTSPEYASWADEYLRKVQEQLLWEVNEDGGVRWRGNSSS
jgi:hypothetical protein